MLQVSDGVEGYQFECKTCPYIYPLKESESIFNRRHMKRKQVDDILGGASAWENVDQTTVLCISENCGNNKAYFYQLQIRSADEPMTTFYKCTVCSVQWREN